MHRTLPAFAVLLLITGCFKPDAGDDEAASDTETETETDDGDSGDTGDTTTTTADDDTTTTDDTSTEDTSETSSGGELPNGSPCTTDDECESANCYVVPFLGGQCGECNEDADCAMTTGGGCTMPNPFENNGSICNMGELGGGCESTGVCMNGLVCGNVLDLLGLIQINTCGNCEFDAACPMGQICAPIVSVSEFTGLNDCIDPNSLPQDSFCELEGNGDQACESGTCSTVDIMGLAQIGACGECNTDADCIGGLDTESETGSGCVPGVFDFDNGTLTGSTCQ